MFLHHGFIKYTEYLGATILAIAFIQSDLHYDWTWFWAIEGFAPALLN